MGKGGNAGHIENKSSMASDFYWAETDEPHASRRKAILAAHPEIKELFGPDHYAVPKIVAVVTLQIALSVYLRHAAWWKLFVVSYLVGAFCNHNLFLAIHELSHNLALTRPLYNKLVALFANLPVGVPMAITFQKYHLEHHTFQGVQGLDVDIPSYTEGWYIRNTASKLVWVLFQLFFYAFRPMVINPKPPGLWEATNLLLELGFDAGLVMCFGWKPLIYLLLSTFVGGGLHPIAGHFIAEHYVFLKGQETYSYYGPLNVLAWNVGYHNEHHDFPRIAGCRLYRVREIAPEFYNKLASHSSWSMVIYRYITDPSVGPFSRIMRKERGTKKE
eukprot:jgi/Mesen1/2228/ME000152S01315